VWGLVVSQTGLMGVLALPLGVTLALILIRVVNRRSFGWSLDVAIDPALLGQGLALAVGAALLAGVHPPDLADGADHRAGRCKAGRRRVRRAPGHPGAR
jgi:hypothetical protein